jgi:hypothetical protein
VSVVMDAEVYHSLTADPNFLRGMLAAVGKGGTGRDGTGRDGTGRDGTGRDGTGRDESSCGHHKPANRKDQWLVGGLPGSVGGYQCYRSFLMRDSLVRTFRSVEFVTGAGYTGQQLAEFFQQDTRTTEAGWVEW